MSTFARHDPQPNMVPKSGSDGKIDAGWIPAGLGGDVAAEAADRIAADNAEAAARISGDATNAAAVTSEAAARAAAISSEASTRAAADSSNAAAISSESSARISGDAANSAAISSEASTARAAESAEAATRAAANALLAKGSWGGMLKAPEVTVYVIEQHATFAGTINALYAQLTSGTCTVAVKINGTAVTSISAAACDNTAKTFAATGANTFAIGDRITFEVAVIASPVGLGITIEWTKTI